MENKYKEEGRNLRITKIDKANEEQKKKSKKAMIAGICFIGALGAIIAGVGLDAVVATLGEYFSPSVIGLAIGGAIAYNRNLKKEEQKKNRPNK